MKLSSFQRRVLRHGLVWGLLVGFNASVYFLGPGTRHESFGVRMLGLLQLAVPIYAHQWLLTHLLERKRYGRYVAATLALVAACTVLIIAFDAAFLPPPPPPSNPKVAALDPGEPANTIGNIVFTLLAATAARYGRRAIKSYFQVQELRTLQVQTELNLLKAQVNQHFLFNTLNNLYGLSLTAPDRIPEALLQLAELMRYQLDTSRQKAVTVGTEAEYLASYIGLEKLRLRANTQVEFSTDLPHPDRPMAPLLLLPLVENCFKHAIAPNGDNHIRIHLTQTATALTLRTDNSIPAHFRPTPSGLGLPTLRQRLDRFYPGPRHSLDVQEAAGRYQAVLRLVV